VVNKRKSKVPSVVFVRNPKIVAYFWKIGLAAMIFGKIGLGVKVPK
jgi:hypothetical protein